VAQIAVAFEASVTVAVNVVSADIASVVVAPLTTGVTAPIPLLILIVVAFVVVHESTAVDPEPTETGFAERVHAGVVPPAPPPVVVTVTAAAHVTEPPAPVAVPVYVVDVSGETDCVPAATGVTAPTPLLILKVVAFMVVHERVDEEPLAIEAGDAVRVQVGAGGTVAYVQTTPV
jgi:hypothetical protein